MNKKILVFGGGTGMSCLLRGLKEFPVSLTAVVSVSDDGGSTGILRDEFDIVAVGDVRKVLVSLSQTYEELEDLLNYRFSSKGSLNKHTVGNVLLTAAKDMTGSMQKGIKLLGKVLNLRGNVMPVTESNIDLYAVMEDDSIIKGEHFITESDKKIKKVFYKDEPVINNKLLKEIKNADLIIFSMGSLYTSILPCILSDKIKEAIDESNAKILYACNLFTQPGETEGFKVSDHIKVINEYLGNKKVSMVIANKGKLDKELANKYLTTEQKDAVVLDHKETSKLVDTIISDDLIRIDSHGFFRHNYLKLAFLIFSVLINENNQK